VRSSGAPRSGGGWGRGARGGTRGSLDGIMAGRPPFPSLTADGDDARHPFPSHDGRRGGGSFDGRCGGGSLDGRRLLRRCGMSWCCCVGGGGMWCSCVGGGCMSWW
jgi:hypothetical protein